MAKQYKAENAQSKYTKINFFFQDKITEEEDFSTTKTTILVGSTTNKVCFIKAMSI